LGLHYATDAVNTLQSQDRAILKALIAGPLPADALAQAVHMPMAMLGLAAKRLADLGYLSARREPPPPEAAPARPRRVYRLTAHGQEIVSSSNGGTVALD
ncbi:MAG: hypothetical protein V3V06_01355, partial [Dehalococcoidia bacterium]